MISNTVSFKIKTIWQTNNQDRHDNNLRSSSSSLLKRPLSPKVNPLIRQDFRSTDIVNTTKLFPSREVTLLKGRFFILERVSLWKGDKCILNPKSMIYRQNVLHQIVVKEIYICVYNLYLWNISVQCNTDV